MILNGRRIEQRTQIVQEGGAAWLAEDLRHNGFDPVIIDGRDPVAIAWAIVEAEDTLSAFAARSDRRYPVKLPYVIAETEKGFGFPGAATNAAHNLPLAGNPRENLLKAQKLLNEAGWTVVNGKRMKDGKPLTLEFMLRQPTMERVAGPMRKNLERLGIRGTLRNVDSAQYDNRTRDFDYDMISVRYGASLNPGSELRQFYSSAAATTTKVNF